MDALGRPGTGRNCSSDTGCPRCWRRSRRGPESYYIGLAAAPSVEYWFPSQKTSAFFSIGGGFGWTDSAGGQQALGQDFTFNWFMQLGLRQKITGNLSLLGGPYYQHLSNGGATDPNPAVDALGFTVGLGWTF